MERKYKDLKTEKEKLYEDMNKEITELHEEIMDLQNVNKDLADYVEILEKNNSIKCQGEKIHELGAKQQRRKLRLIKNKAQSGLWFCESFGLNLTELKLKDENGLNHICSTNFV